MIPTMSQPCGEAIAAARACSHFNRKAPFLEIRIGPTASSEGNPKA
jgi:hypothetical protein